MFNEKLTYSYNILSKLIDTQLVYLTKSVKLKSNEKFKMKRLLSRDKSFMLGVCEDCLVIFKSGFDIIKTKISYDTLLSIEIDVINEKLLKINFNNDQSSFLLVVDNRTKVIENLKCFYTIFYSQIYGEYKELKIELKKNLTLINNDYFNETFKDEFIKKTPKECNTKYYNNYMFYINKDYIMKDLNIFEFNNSITRLIIEINQEMPIEHLNSKLEVQDLAFYSYDKFFKYMNNNFKMNKFWITENSNYIKKCNYSKDSARLEGWRISCRTKPKSGIGFNIIFIFLRRKFIPPIYETYQDFTLILVEEYKTLDDYEIKESSKSIIENVADSLTPEEVHILNKHSEKLIKSKFNSFLIDGESLDYFLNNLNIFGIEALLLGLSFTLKIVLTMSEFIIDKTNEIKQKLLIRVKEAYASIGDKEFNLENYEKNIKLTDFSKMTTESDNYYQSFFKTEVDSSMWTIWDDKRCDFLVFCLNGGLTHNQLNLKILIHYLKGVPECRVLNPQLNRLLNMRVISKKEDIIESRINSIVNNMYNIKEFSFNEEVMCLVIETDYLRIMQDSDSELVYAEFLKFLLENYFSIKILNAIYFYLKQFKNSNGDKDNNHLIHSVKNSLNILLPAFLKLFDNSLLCPTIITLAGKCLIILSNFDKFNKVTLLSQNCVGIVSGYLSNPDEKLIYYSAELLSNVLTEAKDSIQTIFLRNPKLLSKLLKFFKGNSIPDSSYSSKLIILVAKIIINLLLMPNSGIKEMLSSGNNRKFVKYLLNYLQDNNGKNDIEQNIHLQEKIYEILELMVNKNPDFRRYMEDNFRVLKLIDMKCNLFHQCVEYSLGIAKIKNINIINHQEHFMKLIAALIKFLKKFISNDLQIVKSIRLNCLNFVNLITLIYEHKNSEILKIISADCVKLFKILFN